MTDLIQTWDSRSLYTALIALVAFQRGMELRRSRRNERWLRERGAREVGADHYPWMVLLHTAFLIACPLEVWLLERPFERRLAIAMAGTLVLATTLRIWAIRTLGRRWTTRVLVLPGAPRLKSGPYRFFPHPNYVAVVLEIAALPLLHTAWWTALGFSLANGVLLALRIRVEEQALRTSG